MRGKTSLFLLFILLLAGALRLYGLNWDQGFHMHPDERAIVLAVVNLSFPTTFQSFFSPVSAWNPHFFAYGSFPFYLLRIAGNIAGMLNPLLAQYGMINLLGRSISAFADLGTIVLIFFLGRKLFSQSVGLLAAFFYGTSVLPIQLSHFYAVDTMLTCFILATLYFLLSFYKNPGYAKALLIGLFFGLALATKISAFVLIVSIASALTADFLLIFLRRPHRPHHWLPHLTPFIKHLLSYGFVIFVITGITFVLCEPYAVIDFKVLTQQTYEQSVMTHNAFIFPYTLQYVGKVPYLYELTNIFVFGLGPLLATISFLGIFYAFFLAYKKHSAKIAKETILLAFFVSYFLVVGKFAVGFMRYMLPLYPLLALFGAAVTVALISRLTKNYHGAFIRNTFYVVLLASLLLWPVSFVHIYAKPNTRVSASDWINQHIPQGATIAIEHWDDGLPVYGQGRYHVLTLPLYDPDTALKWQGIEASLKQTDYIIIASNRLSTPLQKLTDCVHLPQDRCYPVTAAYYQKLFSGQNVILNLFQDLNKMPKQVRHDEEVIKFTKVAEFTDYPTVPILNLTVNDQWADESFTVYDHPKVIIFQKNVIAR